MSEQTQSRKSPLGRLIQIGRQVTSCYREAGAAALARQVRCAMWSREPYLVIRKELQSTEWPAQYDDFVFRVADLDDLPAICRVWPESLRYIGPDVSAAVRRRMESGATCIVGHATGSPANPAYFSWLCPHDYMLLTLLGTSPSNEHVCAKNLWVSTEFRRRHIAFRGQRFVETVAYERGYRSVWGFIASGNQASCALHDRLGYDRLGTLSFDRRFGRRLATWQHEGRRQRLELCPPEKRVP